jgi:hypothetical protein
VRAREQRAIAVPGASAIRTPAGLLKGLGRFALWALVLVLLLRGVAGVLAQDTSAPAPQPVARSAPAAWPDDAARAFAVGFARAYLSWSPDHADAYVRGLAPFVSPDLAQTVAPQFGEKAPRQVVGTATVARAVALDGERALITVAASVAMPEVVTRSLAVPVARDDGGGLVVDDFPSLVAAPVQAQVTEPETEALPAVEQQQIGDVLEQFFSAFLAGRSADLKYLVPPGVRIAALAHGYELAGISSLVSVGPLTGRERTVLVSLRARDPEAHVAYALRYRVSLVRRDRWYVAAIKG